jgi:hypothetical protein
MVWLLAGTLSQPLLIETLGWMRTVKEIRDDDGGAIQKLTGNERNAWTRPKLVAVGEMMEAKQCWS